MSDPITAFFDAWSLDDAGAQRAAIASVVADLCFYADPRAPEPLTNPEELANYVAQFAANAPGWTARVVHSSQTAGMARVTVAFGGTAPDGSEMVQHGQYFVEVEAGEITRMLGFAGIGAPG